MLCIKKGQEVTQHAKKAGVMIEVTSIQHKP